jgi:hypothetical protein
MRTGGGKNLFPKQLKNDSLTLTNLWFLQGKEYFITLKISYNCKGELLGYKLYERIYQ